MRSLAVLITCHNRKAKTLSCLEALSNNNLPDGYSLDVFLVDDGSMDGTGKAVRECYPQVHLIEGSGSLYWNGGMHKAFSKAIDKGFDYYLWLNDDTQIYADTLARLLNTSQELQNRFQVKCIVAGSTRNLSDGRLSYGGVIRSHCWKATHFELVEPRDEPIECETMNGNCVLIPSGVVQKVGNLDAKFAHAMGDLDYGLRARYAGFGVWVMPGYAGTCEKNRGEGSFNDAQLPVGQRLRKMLQPKGLPLSSWRVFTQRHAGVLWPIFWLWPYVKVILKGLINK